MRWGIYSFSPPISIGILVYLFKKDQKFRIMKFLMVGEGGRDEVLEPLEPAPSNKLSNIYRSKDLNFLEPSGGSSPLITIFFLITSAFCTFFCFLKAKFWQKKTLNFFHLKNLLKQRTPCIDLLIHLQYLRTSW